MRMFPEAIRSMRVAQGWVKIFGPTCPHFVLVIEFWYVLLDYLTYNYTFYSRRWESNANSASVWIKTPPNSGLIARLTFCVCLIAWRLVTFLLVIMQLRLAFKLGYWDFAPSNAHGSLPDVLQRLWDIRGLILPSGSPFAAQVPSHLF